MLKTAKITDSIYTIRYQLHLFELLFFSDFQYENLDHFTPILSISNGF
jgi:hypothetical protein